MSQATTTSSETNRRRSRRMGTASLARIECRKGALGLGPNIIAYPLDICENGIRLVLRTLVGAKQEVEIVMQGGGLLRPIKRIAEVMWSVPLEDGHCCVGVLFQKNLPHRDVQSIGRSLR